MSVTPGRCDIVLLLICLCGSALPLYLGDMCHHKRQDAIGMCKLLRDCGSAMIDLRKRIYPEHCGFIQTSVIVCCVDTKAEAATTSTTLRPTDNVIVTSPPITDTTSKSITTVTTTLSSESKLKRVPGEISHQKCKEYEDLAYEEEFSPALTVQAEIIKNEICPWVLEPAISGGTKASLGEFPHMVLLKYKSSARCGGTLISERFVITAGHCINEERNIIPIRARLGDLNISNPTDNAYVQEIGVKKAHVHPGFTEPVQYNDLALIELVHPAKLSVFLKPACLYTREKIDFKMGLATGWGKTEEHVFSDHLLKVYLEIFPQETCSQRYASLPMVFPNGINDSIEICAGSIGSNKDTCGGDSGGPFQIYSTDFYCSHYLVGVTSFGIRCGQANLPAVYTKIFPYLEWIENIVWPE